MEKDLFNEMISSDFDLAYKSFTTDDFQMLNISGNRIMSDCILGSLEDGPRISLLGFFIKQISMNYLDLKPRLSASDFLTAKTAGEESFNTLKTQLKESDINVLWESFYTFNCKIIVFFKNDIEKASYNDNPAISEAIRLWVLDYLSKRKELLLNPRNELFKGILGEILRAHNVYGFRLEDTITASYLVAIDRYYEYIRYQYDNHSGTIISDTGKDVLFKYIDLASSLLLEKPIKLVPITDLIFHLIVDWRELFITYGELHRVQEKRIELSTESKQRLSEVVSKAIQKDLKN